jgi:hypothetical protein
MKRAMVQGLPILEFIQDVDTELARERGGASVPEGPLGRERHGVAQAKKLVAYTTKQLLQREPAEIGRKQQHLEILADMIIDLYAMESAVARTAKIVRARGLESAGFECDATAIFVADATERLGANARRLFGNDAAAADIASHFAVIARLTPLAPLGTIDARERVAKHITAAGGVLP